MKRIILIVLALACSALMLVAPVMAEEAKAPASDKKETQSVGESIGSTARQVADDSKEAYHETKDTVVKTYKDVVEDFKKAVKEAKESGAKTVEDVKKGYQKTPAPEASPSGDAPKEGAVEKESK